MTLYERLKDRHYDGGDSSSAASVSVSVSVSSSFADKLHLQRGVFSFPDRAPTERWLSTTTDGAPRAAAAAAPADAAVAAAGGDTHARFVDDLSDDKKSKKRRRRCKPDGQYNYYDYYYGVEEGAEGKLLGTRNGGGVSVGVGGGGGRACALLSSIPVLSAMYLEDGETNEELIRAECTLSNLLFEEWEEGGGGGVTRHGDRGTRRRREGDYDDEDIDIDIDDDVVADDGDAGADSDDDASKHDDASSRARAASSAASSSSSSSSSRRSALSPPSASCRLSVLLSLSSCCRLLDAFPAAALPFLFGSVLPGMQSLPSQHLYVLLHDVLPFVDLVPSRGATTTTTTTTTNKATPAPAPHAVDADAVSNSPIAKHLKSLFLGSATAVKFYVISCFNSMLLRCGRVGSHPQFLASLIQFVDSLILVGLISESTAASSSATGSSSFSGGGGPPLLLQASLDFFKSASGLSKTCDLVAPPSPALTYRLLLSSDVAGVDGICQLLVDYKSAFETARARATASGNRTCLGLERVVLFNGFVLDVCNVLWSCKGPAAAGGGILYTEFDGALLDELRELHERGSNVYAALSLTHSSAFATFAKEFLEARSKKGKAVDGGLDGIKGGVKVKYLEYLKERGFVGVYGFLTTFIKSLNAGVAAGAAAGAERTNNTIVAT